MERREEWQARLARGWEAVQTATPGEKEAFVTIWDDIQGTPMSDEAKRTIWEWYQRTSAEPHPPR